MTIIHLTSGQEFAVESGITLLDADLSAGIALPYSCRTGRCSTCKAHVQRGQTRPLTDETGLSPEEIEARWILTCVRTAETDVELDIENLGGFTLPQPKTLSCRIAELEKLAPDVMRLKLRLSPTTTFSFIPGQYIDVIGINGTRRSYSLANASYSKELFELHIRAVNDGAMSDYWLNHKELNDLLGLNGPLGTFFLREFINSDIFLGDRYWRSASQSHAGIIDVCFPSTSSPSQLPCCGGERPKVSISTSQPSLGGTVISMWFLARTGGRTGAEGHVQDIFLSTMADLSNAAVYACGS